MLDGWDVSWKIIRQVGLDLESEEDCVHNLNRCVLPRGQLRLPRRHRLLAPPRNGSIRNLHNGRYRSHRPRCTTHNPKLGLKVVSMMGNAEQGGDHDDSSSWVGDLLDSNEKIVTINLRAPTLLCDQPLLILHRPTLANPSRFVSRLQTLVTSMLRISK